MWIPLVALLLITVYFCEYALRPLREIPYHLHRIQRDPKDRELHREIVRFSCQLQLQKITFNARRFLDVDFKLLKGVCFYFRPYHFFYFSLPCTHPQIIAAIAVYLTIVIQFMPRNEKKKVNMSVYG